MPTKGSKTTVQEDGVDKDAYVVAFTNGAYQELEELQKKFNLKDVDSVIKVAITILKRVPAEGEKDGQQPATPTNIQ